MNLLIYLILVNLCLAVCWLFYHLFLRNETFHTLNRAFLLGSIVLAYLLPLLQSQWVQDLFITQQIVATVQASEVYQVMLVLPAQEEAGITWFDLFLWVYFAGVGVAVARLGWNFYVLKKHMQKEHAGEAWSFFNLKKIDPELEGQTYIQEHETVHARQGHSFDIILAEVLIVLNWFNPAMYLMRMALRRLHEFIADAKASGDDKAAYAMLLLSKQFGVSPSALAHPFFDLKQLKSRIAMMKKDPSKKASLLKYGLLLPLFGGFLVLSAATTNNNPITLASVKLEKLGEREIRIDTPEQRPGNDEADLQVKIIPGQDTTPRESSTEPPVAMPNPVQTDVQDNTPVSFASVEVLPMPQDGMPGFGKYIRDNYKVPDGLIKSGTPGGRITMSFIVELDGDLSNVKVLRDLGYGTGAEAKRVLESMPAWKPGIQNGKPVRVAYTLPIAISTGNEKVGQTGTGQINDFTPVSFASVEVLPQPQGGMAGFGKYMRENLRVPDAFRKSGKLGGRVTVSFVVEKDGSISDTHVLRDLGYGTGEAAVRALKGMPAWSPGIQNGKKVRVAYTLPIEIANGNTADTTKKIQGKVEGLQVSPAKVMLRENNGAKPLYVIDGVPVQSKELPSNVKPNDIESITVLKDAQAKSLYGEKAKDGVLLVTTKKGSQKKKEADAVQNLKSRISQSMDSAVQDAKQYAQAKERSLQSAKVTGYANPTFDDVKQLNDFDGIILIDGKVADKNLLKAIRPESIQRADVYKSRYGKKEDASLTARIHQTFPSLKNEDVSKGVIAVTLKK